MRGHRVDKRLDDVDGWNRSARSKSLFGGLFLVDLERVSVKGGEALCHRVELPLMARRDGFE